MCIIYGCDDRWTDAWSVSILKIAPLAQKLKDSVKMAQSSFPTMVMIYQVKISLLLVQREVSGCGLKMHHVWVPVPARKAMNAANQFSSECAQFSEFLAEEGSRAGMYSENSIKRWRVPLYMDTLSLIGGVKWQGPVSNIYSAEKQNLRFVVFIFHPCS